MADNWSPSAKLYASNGLTLIYTFPLVQDHNLPRNQSKKYIKQTNYRASNEIIVPGGNQTWEVYFKFILAYDNYTDLANALETLESTVVENTAYLLRVDKSQTTYFNQSNGGYKVKRLKPFEYLDRETDRMTYIQKIAVYFDSGAW